MKRLLMLLLIPCFLGVVSLGCDDDTGAVQPDLSNTPADLCNAHDAGHC